MIERMSSMPSVDDVLGLETVRNLLKRRRREHVVGLIRRALQDLRQELLLEGESGEDGDPDPARQRAGLLVRVGHALERAAQEWERPGLRPVINATGVILHTGLGRAPLTSTAAQAIQQAAEHYCNLELDLDSGARGSRLDHVEGLVCDLAGCEAEAVVNNNAGAVLLILNTLALGREVVISRGELVEIGGAFRMPDIIAASGARLREVGTTNRTHLRDYEGAIGKDTALLLAVHPSNYRVRGFTKTVALQDLVGLSRKSGVPLVYDLGGGALRDLGQWGLPAEPVVADSLAVGVDVVSFSGDKVLGGPQSGIIAGSAKLVEPVRRSPMMRALRCDKLILAGLEATLRLYACPPEALCQALPVLRMMAEPSAGVKARAEGLLAVLSTETAVGMSPEVVESRAQAGSGALPLEEIPSWAVALRPSDSSAEELGRRLRLGTPAVVGRISRERLWLDMRTVQEGEVAALATAIDAAHGGAR